jgi:cysteine desulfurase / selenocysteine lyase
MVNSVSFEHAGWSKPPQKFEAGTPPIAQAIGLGAAIDYISHNINFAQAQKHEAALCNQLLTELVKIKNIKIVGSISDIKEHGHLISFVIDGVHAHDIAGYLGSKGIAVRAGHHCAQPLVRALGFESLVRVSFAIYNTQEEVDIFVMKLKEALKFFGVN